MPFGFGFNKAKVLASAEKNVKAGKLQHAIADYEKIVKEDAKDLTVLNTIGDLYARLGNTEQATSYYKRVGDAFAGNGFTVKAIAMYKKITKLDSSAVDSLTRLAELYAQQGLQSDARAQYVLVAEHHLKAGSLDRAANVFHKVLDLDPENAAMQAKLAELYGRLGKKNEARDIYLRNAELYRSRQNFAAADESLGQVLAIDKTFSQAILLRGLVKMELGDAAAALQCLEQVPDIDSRPEGLRSMLKAYFALGKIDAAGPLARKMYSVSQETQGLSSYGDALVHAGRTEEALAFYTEFADVLLSGQNESVISALQGCIARVKDNPAALEQLSGLLERAGHTTNLAEIKELLAHASVQSGDLAKARELYRELARLEPDNPLHTQNYRQVLVKLGEDSSARPLSAEEAAQPMLVDELEGTLPEIPREYAPELADAVRAALTEAELFDSYNLPAKALAPLEAVISRAPRDPQVNQRLASLYARTNRLADAAARCRLLEQVYHQAGYQREAQEYAELAAKYGARAGSGAAETVPSSAAVPVFEKAAPTPTEARQSTTPPAFGLHEIEKSGSVAEFEFVPSTPEPVEHHAAATPVEAKFTAAAPAQPATPSEPARAAAPILPAQPAPAVANVPIAPPAPTAAAASAEFDLSAEWEQMTEFEVDAHSDVTAAASVESKEAESAVGLDPLEQRPVSHVAPPVPDPTPAAERPSQAESAATTGHEFVLEQTTADANADAAIFEMLGASPESGYPEHISDLIEEIRFYASQSMWDEAHAAIAKLKREAPEAAANLQHEFQGHAPTASSTTTAEPFADFMSHKPAAPAHEQAEVFEAAAGAHAADPFAPASQPSSHELESFAEPVAHEPAPFSPAEVFAYDSVTPAAPAPIFEAPPFIHEEMPVAARELSFATSAAEPLLTDAEPILEPVEVASSTHADGAAHGDSIDSLLDLDSALGDDFEIAPVAVVAGETHTFAAAASASGHTAQPIAAAAAPAFVAPPVAPTPVMTPAPAVNSAAPASQSSGPAPTDGAFDFSDGALADIFNEFKHDMEGAADGGSAEDPETHYNLGVAFKEMGLLDEAIGELQKVCQAIDRGESFPQALQAYTWLADCFVQKGVPEAAIRWYEKALRSPHVGAETATAIHYELACACEQAGNRTSALTHFMEVYGTNIDYRDVAERIKSLKS
jgi:tetratricopeptide (TPR) repeat protein